MELTISKRTLPHNKTLFHKRIINSVNDYYGDSPLKEQRGKKDIMLWLMNRRKGVKLNEEQKGALWIIRNNLADPIYSSSLV